MSEDAKPSESEMVHLYLWLRLCSLITGISSQLGLTVPALAAGEGCSRAAFVQYHVPLLTFQGSGYVACPGYLTLCLLQFALYWAALEGQLKAETDLVCDYSELN